MSNLRGHSGYFSGFMAFNIVWKIKELAGLLVAYRGRL